MTKTRATPLKVAMAIRKDGRIVGLNIAGLSLKKFRVFFTKDPNFKELRFAYGCVREIEDSSKGGR